MVSGRAPEIQWIVIRLSAILTREQIAIYTGVSFSAVHNILNYFDTYKTIKISEEDEDEEDEEEEEEELNHAGAHYLIVSNYPPPPHLHLYSPLNAQGVPQPLPHLPAQPHAHNNAPAPVAAPAAYGHSSGQPLSTAVVFPKIGPWLIGLDQQPHRNRRKVKFSSLGESLERNGFFRICDLASKFVSAKKLMELLETNYGTVVALLQYAHEDTEACRVGRL